MQTKNKHACTHCAHIETHEHWYTTKAMQQSNSARQRKWTLHSFCPMCYRGMPFMQILGSHAHLGRKNGKTRATKALSLGLMIRWRESIFFKWSNRFDFSCLRPIAHFRPQLTVAHPEAVDVLGIYNMTTRCNAPHTPGPPNDLLVLGDPMDVLALGPSPASVLLQTLERIVRTFSIHSPSLQFCFDSFHWAISSTSRLLQGLFTYHPVVMPPWWCHRGAASGVHVRLPSLRSWTCFQRSVSWDFGSLIICK